MSSDAAAGRAALVDALRAVPPEAPTLCAGWTARDLAAHVVARERRPDSTPGLVISWLAGWTNRVRQGYARKPYPELVDLIAAGPPWTSLFALPGVDGVFNFVEFLIHAEDVRRAQPQWQPRELPAGTQDRIWSMLRSRGRMFFRSAPVALVLERAGSDPTEATDRVRIGGQGPEVVLTGEPLELLLYATGRRAQARVELTGPDEAVRSVESMRLGI